jgi:prepilin peptidase CpaA
VNTSLWQSLTAVGYAGLAVYLTVVAAWDLKARRIPNRLTLPALGAVLLWRIGRVWWAIADGRSVGPEFAFLVPWAVLLLVVWPIRVMGGGDVKLLLILFGVFPTFEFLVLVLLVSGVIISSVLLWRYGRRRRVGQLCSWLVGRLFGGRLAPTQEELDTGIGEPTAFLFAAAGMLMIVLRCV